MKHEFATPRRATVKRVSPVVASEDLATSLSFWESVLAAAPTFVDGMRWAQFDIAGSRVSIGAGSERPDGAALMVSVDDLDAYRLDLADDGIDIGEVIAGPHERRAVFRGPSGELVIAFQSVPRP